MRHVYGREAERPTDEVSRRLANVRTGVVDTRVEPLLDQFDQA